MLFLIWFVIALGIYAILLLLFGILDFHLNENNKAFDLPLDYPILSVTVSKIFIVLLMPIIGIAVGLDKLAEHINDKRKE